MDSSRPMHAIYIPAGDAALRPVVDLIPFKSDVLCGWKNAAKQRKSVDPGALALFINPT